MENRIVKNILARLDYVHWLYYNDKNVTEAFFQLGGLYADFRMWYSEGAIPEYDASVITQKINLLYTGFKVDYNYQ